MAEVRDTPVSLLSLPLIAVPLFSVVIPLEYHRDLWDKCLRAWLMQSLANSEYELLLICPPGFSERDYLENLLSETNNVWRVVESDHKHDMGLCAFGAQHARGRYLFFTESHCWPASDVLALCVQAFEQHHDWSGLSCRSSPVTATRRGEAEAAMYVADIDHGMTVHPWRKILDQCFVTRREVYARCGGFKPEFGHFAEWALAANYHALGFFVGYLPAAHFSHPYFGDLRGLRLFTSDFVGGETRYLFDAASEPGSPLIEVPDEWMTEGNFDASLARALLKTAIRHRKPRTALRWLTPAIFGDRLCRTTSWFGMIASHVRVFAAMPFSSRRKRSAAFKNYSAAVIHHQRLSSIAHERKRRGGSARAGFHPIESVDGTQFRWSEPVAMVRIDLPAGRANIVIDCLTFAAILTMKELRFRLSGKEVADADVLLEPHRIVISAHADKAHASTLSWICSRVHAPTDSRVLGLPVTRISILT